MVITSTTAEELGDVLRRASAGKQSVVIRGGGTKSDWPRRTRSADVVLSTLGLNRLLAHEHGDLTATIEAGATLRDVNAALARHGQWLPVDPSFADAATIGGILATNDAGPLRHRYGTPRDQVIGIRVATGDGLLAKAGGQVVKNVAGYDLSKLVTGSFGTLAAIVSATFKLSPLPRASATLVVTSSDDAYVAHVAQIVRKVMASQLEPIAFEVHATLGARPFQARDREPERLALRVRFASVPEAVAAQLDALRALAALKGCATSVVEGDDERALWREHNEQIWRSPGAILRASWLPARIDAVLAGLKACATALSDIEIVGRAAVGAGLIRVDGDDAAQARGVDRLRASGALGNIVVLRGSDALKGAWHHQPLADAVKRAFDPQGILL